MKFKSVSLIFALAISGIVLSGASTKADDFTFSFTGTSGNVSGTVTGEILGLTNNSTSSAVEVILESYPPTFTPAPDLSTTPVDVTSWSDVSSNRFTETVGSITAYDFDALTSSSGPNSLLYLASGDGTLYGDYGGQGYDLMGPITFTPLVSAVPEPGSLALFGSGLFGLAGIFRRRMSK